ncbi:MAG: AAA family ATPase, partial [Micrococcales bacterium]|nr:AAA family ATPase [Micrococcales bacterium]
MSTTPPSAFALPQALAHKAVTAKIHLDDAHFAAGAKRLRDETTTIELRLESLRRQPGGRGQQALDRDLEIHRLTARLRALSRYGIEICLGRFDPVDSPPVYVGRFGLTDADGSPLLLDWRAPAARPFFAATPAHPEGVASRRRYRWNHGRIVDYWDEALMPDADAAALSLDDDSAFLASLGASRSARMRDVLGTIQADQDAIIRAPSTGALVVDGGPGTGKTVVALHRAAYLVATDPRLAPGRGGILFVGPHEPYLAYVADVLPSLGEDSVLTCTIRDFVPDAVGSPDETDTRVAALKADARIVGAIEPAVRLYEEPPTRALAVGTAWGELTLAQSDWEEAFAAVEPGTPHNEARSQVWVALLEILSDQTDPEDAPP